MNEADDQTLYKESLFVAHDHVYATDIREKSW